MSTCVLPGIIVINLDVSKSILEFRLNRPKSVIAVRLANVYQERQRDLATSYQLQP
jgi:hypothetical protein